MQSFFGNSKKTCAYGLFILASMVYLGSLAPTIAWRDAAEFVTVVHTLGISHPAGSPTYALLAKPLAWLPLGSLALRVNLASALFGALAVSGLFVLLYERFPTAPPWIRLGAAVSGALFLLVSESFWRFAAVAEVYTLQNGFLLLLLLLLLKARASRPAQALLPVLPWYGLFAFLYGVSAGVHATMAFFAPAFLTFLWLTEPRLLRGRSGAGLAFFLLLGLSVYLYLPLRSLGDPAFDWGNPQTFEQLLRHLSDRKDAATHWVWSWAKLPYQLRVYASNLSNEFTPLGVVLGLVGCVAVVRQDKACGALWGLVFLGNVGFFIRTWTSAFGFIPSFVIFAVWIGYGVHACLSGVVVLYQHHRIRLARGVVFACLLGGIMVTLGLMGVRHAAVASQAGNYSAELYGKQLLAHLPPNAIVFSQDAWFKLLYLQHVERQRPDLTVLLQGEIFTPHYFAPISATRFPNIQLTAETKPVAMSTVDYFWYLARLNEHEHPLFWDPEPDFDQQLAEHLLPQGFLYALHPSHTTPLTPQVLHTHRELLTRAVPALLQHDRDGEAARFLARKMKLLGLHFKRRGFLDETVHMYQRGLHLRPDDYWLRNNYGSLLLSQGKLQQALAEFNLAYGDNPTAPSVNKNLGTIMLSVGQDAQAAYFFKRALAFGATDGDLYLLLGATYIRLARFAEAKQALQAALAQFAEPSPVTDTEDHLQEKRTWAQENLHRLEQGLITTLIPLEALGASG
jgi:hypothetical protein